LERELEKVGNEGKADEEENDKDVGRSGDIGKPSNKGKVEDKKKGKQEENKACRKG